MPRGVTSNSHGRLVVVGVLMSGVILDAWEGVVCVNYVRDLIVAGMDRDEEHVVKFNEQGELVWLSNTRDQLYRVEQKNANVIESEAFMKAVKPKYVRSEAAFMSEERVAIRKSVLEKWGCDIFDRNGHRLGQVECCPGEAPAYNFYLWFTEEATPHEKTTCRAVVSGCYELRKAEANVQKAEANLQKAKDEFRRIEAELRNALDKLPESERHRSFGL